MYQITPDPNIDLFDDRDYGILGIHILLIHINYYIIYSRC